MSEYEKGKKDYDKYEDEIEDIDEIPGTDVKINPEFYIHNAILKAQAALNNPDLRVAVIYYRLYIENLEALAESAKMLPNDYATQLIDYQAKDKEYTGSKEDYVKDFKLATYKMKLILGRVFAAKVSTQAAKA